MNLSIQLDQKAKGLAKQYLFSEKELISVLAEMDEKKIFLSLGFTGVFNYASYPRSLAALTIAVFQVLPILATCYLKKRFFLSAFVSIS